MKQTKPLPSLFLRIFLSHLILILFCFCGGYAALAYLFDPGVKLFLRHNPLILIPVMLGLIGVAGLLSVWSAGKIAGPIERLSRAFSTDDPEISLHTYIGNPLSEEMEKLIASIRSHQNTQFSSLAKSAAKIRQVSDKRILIIDLDPELRIRFLNRAAEKLTSQTVGYLCGKDVFETIFRKKEAIPASEIQSLRSAAHQIKNLLIPVSTSTGEKTILWNSTNTYDIYGNFTGKRLFGIMVRRK